MDGVEYYINRDLADAGLESEKSDKVEFPELESVFESGSRTWRPHRGFNIPIVKHARVDHWIKIFNGPLRPRFEQWIRRGSYLAPVMEKILREHNVPTDLIYLSMIESGFNMNAYSHAHAAGAWQFIPSTGKLYGLSSGGYLDERRDLIKATNAAAAHLKDLYKMYGDWHLAFAAYNAGPGSVNRAIRKSGSRNYWKMTEGNSRFFRQETKDYVPRIIAAATIVKDYKKYGYSNKLFEAPLDFDLVTVKDSIDLESIARCSRSSVEEIQYLNASLVYGVTPPGQTCTLMVPGGTKDIFERNYSKMPRMAAKKQTLTVHKVKKKETLASIASRYRVSLSTLASNNNLKTKSKLTAGMTLVVPQQRFGQKLKTINDRPEVAKSRRLFDKNSRESEDAIAENELADQIAAVVEESAVAAEKAPEEPIIALKNAQEAPSELKPLVEETTVPDAALPVQDPAAVSNPALVQDGPQVAAVRTHRVKSGETLSYIAAQYGVRISQLKEWNRLGTKGVVKTGQTLRIGAPKVAAAAPSISNNRDRVIIHSVRNGETLWDLAKKYRVSVNQLRNWNRLTGNHLYPKQKIRIIASASIPTGKKVALASQPAR